MFRDTLRDTGYFKLCHNAIDCYIISILVGYYGKSHEFSMKARVSTPQDPRLFITGQCCISHLHEVQSEGAQKLCGHLGMRGAESLRFGII